MKKLLLLLALFLLPVASASWLAPVKISGEKTIPFSNIFTIDNVTYVFWKGDGLEYAIIKGGSVVESGVVYNKSIQTFSIFYDKTFHVIFSQDGILNYMELGINGSILKHAILQTFNATEPDLAVDKDGKVHIVWVEEAKEGREVYYGTLEENFTKMRLTSSNYTCRRPRIKIDGYGYIHILWHEMNIRRVMYAKLYGDKVVLRKTLKDKDAYWISFDIDAENNLHIAWQDGKIGKGNILYMKMKNSSIIMEKIISRGNDMKPNLRVDSEGNAHIVWQTGSSLYHAVINEKSVKVERIIKIKHAQYPSISLGYNNTPNVVFYRWEEGDEPFIIYYTFKTGEERKTPMEFYLIIAVLIITIAYKKYFN